MDDIRIRGIEERVMKSIREGGLVMRPKWHFEAMRFLKIGGALLAVMGFSFFLGSFIFAFLAHHNAGFSHASYSIHWACDNAVFLGLCVLTLFLAFAAYKLSQAYRDNIFATAALIAILIVGIGGAKGLHGALLAWSAEKNVAPIMVFYNDVLGVDHEAACKAHVTA